MIYKPKPIGDVTYGGDFNSFIPLTLLPSWVQVLEDVNCSGWCITRKQLLQLDSFHTYLSRCLVDLFEWIHE